MKSAQELGEPVGLSSLQHTCYSTVPLQHLHGSPLSEARIPSIRAVPIKKYRSILCSLQTLYQLDFSFAFTCSPFTQTLCCILELKQDPDPKISLSLNGGVIRFFLSLFCWPAREKGDFYVSLWRDIRSVLEV